MPMNNVVISRYGTEKEFIADFVKSIMSESAFTSQHSLVCSIGSNSDSESAVTVTTSAEVDTQLNTAFGNSGNTPCIRFDIDTCCKIAMIRSSAVSSDANGYSFYVIYNGVSDPAPHIPLFVTSSTNATNRTTRTFRYQVISNANAISISVGGVSSTFPLVYSSDIPSIFVYKNNNSDFICGKTIASVMRDVSGNAVTSVNRLGYINNGTDPTAIEIIESKVCVISASSTKIVAMVNVWDSSYNSAVLFPVTIGNSTYVYLNNYTLMPI